MNNIEKLIDAVEISAKNAEWDDFDNAIHALKALQSSEPVAWRIKHEDDDEWDISCDKPITVGNYEVQPLFTIPPSTVPLEEHNKRIAELEADIDTYVPIANQQATEIMQLQATNKTLLDALKVAEDMFKRAELMLRTEHAKLAIWNHLNHSSKFVKKAIADAEGLDK